MQIKEELIAILEEYLADCKQRPVKTGFGKPIKWNDDGTHITQEIITNGIEPTFPGFISWLRTKKQE